MLQLKIEIKSIVVNEEELVTRNLEVIFIELPKFIKKNPDVNERLCQWLWLISGRKDKVKMADKELEEVKKATKLSKKDKKPQAYPILDNLRFSLLFLLVYIMLKMLSLLFLSSIQYRWLSIVLSSPF